MISNRVFYTAVILLLIAAIWIVAFSARGPLKVVATNLENIPMTIGEYQGIEDSFSESIYKELNADKHVYRHYRSEEGKQIDLYIGYYGTAKGGRTGHNPYACLPGSGWAIINDQKVGIDGSDEQENVYWKDSQINQVTARRDDEYSVMYHWYQTNGDKILATGVQQNIQRFVGRVFHNRNDGAYVQITVASNGDGLPDARQRGMSFVKQILPLLPVNWPVER